jgi:hypothetical protein
LTDAGSYPFKQAAHYTKGRTAAVRLIVIHDMEAPEKATTAEAVQSYFARSDSRVASAHLCVDSDSVARCVHDADTAYGAAHANSIGLHVEHAGYGRQSRAEWLDAFGKAMLELSAEAVARWCVAYKIPVVKLSGADLQAGKHGICGHKDVSDAWPSTGHTDPGPGFPWDYYLGRVRAHVAALTAQPVAPRWWPHDLKLHDVNQAVASVCVRLHVPQRVTFDVDLDNRVRYVQSAHGLPITGVVDRATAIAIG